MVGVKGRRSYTWHCSMVARCEDGGREGWREGGRERGESRVYMM